MQYRLKLNGAIAKTMLDCDLLLVPAIPTPAPMAEMFSRSMTADEFDGLTRFTAVFDMTGQPTLSLNGGFDGRGVPMGFQLAGKGARRGAAVPGGPRLPGHYQLARPASQAFLSNKEDRPCTR